MAVKCQTPRVRLFLENPAGAKSQWRAEPRQWGRREPGLLAKAKLARSPRWELKSARAKALPSAASLKHAPGECPKWGGGKPNRGGKPARDQGGAATAETTKARTGIWMASVLT